MLFMVDQIYQPFIQQLFNRSFLPDCAQDMAMFQTNKLILQCRHHQTLVHGFQMWFLPDLVNKVLLEHSHTHLFVYYHCLFHVPMVDLGSCERDYITHKASNIYLLALFRKSVLSPRQGIYLNQLFIFVMTDFILMI